MSAAAQRLGETRLRFSSQWSSAQELWQDAVASRFGEEQVAPLLDLLQSVQDSAETAIRELGNAAELVEKLSNGQ